MKKVSYSDQTVIKEIHIAKNTGLMPLQLSIFYQLWKNDPDMVIDDLSMSEYQKSILKPNEQYDIIDYNWSSFNYSYFLTDYGKELING